MITIKDVAELAQVAPSTVSRVIADSPEISQATKDKVRQAMKELNYYPNLNARRLVSGQQEAIGLILPNESEQFYRKPFLPAVLKGINAQARHHKFSISLISGDSSEERLSHVKKSVYGREFSAFIFLYAMEDDPVLDFCLEENFPFIVIGRVDNEAVYQIDNDNVQAAYDATQYLIERGYQKIGLVTSTENRRYFKDRQIGYLKALKDHDFDLDEELIFKVPHSRPEDGYQLGQVIPRTSIDCLLVAEELIDLGLQTAWREIYQQELLSITFKAFNDSIMFPSLKSTYIDVSAQELGLKAFELLVLLLENKADQIETITFLPHQLIRAHH